jgi:hypothetical protein
MAKDWKKEVSRDCIAFGSIPFYFIVMIRSIIGRYAIFVYQLLIAFVVLVVLSKIVKKSDIYVARTFVLVVFTSLFYQHNLYTIFAFLLWGLVIVSSNYLKVKRNVIIKGTILGIIGSGIAYYLAQFLPVF